MECVKIAGALTGLDAEVVVFEDNRVFIAASTRTDLLMMPRPMTDAEIAAAASGGRRTEVVDGPSASAVLPICQGDSLVAGLSLFGEPDIPTDTTGLDAIARIIAGLVDTIEVAQTNFHEKVLGGLRECVLIMSPEMELVWASQGSASLFGYSPLELKGRSAVEFLHPDDIEKTLDGIIKISAGLEVYRLIVRVLNATGAYTPVEVMGNDLTADPEIGGIVLSLRDAQHDSELGQEIERSRQLSSAIVEGLPDGLVATDQYGHINMANTVARSMFDIDSALTAAQLSLESFDLFTIDGRSMDFSEPTDLPVRCLLPDEGDIRYLDCSVRAVAAPKADTFGRVVVFTDVTAEHRAAEDLREQALHDQLTGLPNRRQMEARLVELASDTHADVVAACFIDLDGFKLVNDNHGHRVGDQVIRLAAQRLQRQLRDADLLVRHGGDEFVALLVGASSMADAQETAERFRSVLAEPYDVSGERFDLTASIGVALSPTRDLNSELLLQHADIALYEAKGNGRNRVQAFDESLALAVSTEQKQRRVLRDAIDEDRVVMHFQPLVDSASETTRGFEALARVRTADGELLTPAHFLDAVSQTGLMWDLDRIAFQLSCDAARLLHTIDPEHPPYVACNFSSVSITHPDFVDFVVATTRGAAIATSQICIEVTESAAFDSADRSAGALRTLKDHGYRLALDDFGTGYSSLAHLRDLPITSVKVDRSFVEQLGAHTSERAIAEAVVTLARDLQLGVVAEGVETVEQMEQVKAMGFETIQGWHYSRALPIDRCLEHWRQITDANHLHS